MTVPFLTYGSLDGEPFVLVKSPGRIEAWRVRDGSTSWTEAGPAEVSHEGRVRSKAMFASTAAKICLSFRRSAASRRTDGAYRAPPPRPPYKPDAPSLAPRLSSVIRKMHDPWRTP